MLAGEMQVAGALADRAALQLPGPATGRVLVATEDGIEAHELGVQTIEVEVSGLAGDPVRPLVRDGCVYGAWSTGTAWRGCGRDDVALALSGVDFVHFWLALALLGVGWNFLYIGGTTLLTEAYFPAERAKAQGANDFCIFATVALTSLASGYLVNRSGWSALNVASVPLLVVATVGLAVLSLRRSSAVPATQ